MSNQAKEEEKMVEKYLGITSLFHKLKREKKNKVKQVIYFHVAGV